ncbi:MAG: orotidine-5'-phosphate decarboxylase [Verrucomicrobiota bacterium]
MRYGEKLGRRIEATGSRLCVGLDPRPEWIEGRVVDFLERVVKETLPHAACFKPNMAYFESMGRAGYEALESLFQWIPEDCPVILDAKRGDIGATQAHYAKAYFENWNVDAVTLSPYMGMDSIAPFLAYPGRGVYLLGVTSNPGAADLQLQRVGERFLFELVQDFAQRAAGLPGDVGLVVGLTNAAEEVMDRVRDLPLLLPGLGAQGGELSSLRIEERQAPWVVNVSRGISFAEPEKSFQEKAQAYADQIARIARGND